MLLTEYDEQAHIESEKKIAREEGIQEGINLMATLFSCLKRDGRLEEMDHITEEAVRQRLYKEYHLTD